MRAKRPFLPCPEYDVKPLAMAVPSGVVLGVIPGVVLGPSTIRAQVNRKNGNPSYGRITIQTSMTAQPNVQLNVSARTVDVTGGIAGQAQTEEEPLIFDSAVDNST